MNATIELEMPQAMAYFVAAQGPKNALERNALMLYPFIKDLSISHGRAAELLGISKRKLIDTYGDMGIPYIDMDISEIEDELAVFEEIEASSK